MSEKRRFDKLIETVTADTFDALVLRAEGPIAVEFMSYGCAHCRAIEPALEQAAEQVASQERVFRVNVAVEKELARAYEINGTPTFVMFSGSREVGRSEGPHPNLSSVMTAITEPFTP